MGIQNGKHSYKTQILSHDGPILSLTLLSVFQSSYFQIPDPDLNYHPQIRRGPHFTSSIGSCNDVLVGVLALGGFPITTVFQHTTKLGCHSSAVYLQLAATYCSGPSERGFSAFLNWS